MAGRIVDEDVERLRERSDIVEVISGYSQLKKAGRVFKGLCCFHQEKTPSFIVDPAKGVYHCLAGETGVITWKGTVPIAKLAGDTHRLLTTGGLWVDAEVRSFGVQRLWAVHLRRNRRKKTIYATDGHRWLLRNRKSQVRVTRELRPGDRLAYAFPNSPSARLAGPAPFGVAHGFTFGDGCRTPYGCVAQFAGDKDHELLEYFPRAKIWVRSGPPKIGRLPLFFKDPPSLDEAPGYLYGWLAGYFAADGCVSEDGQVILASSSSEVLEFVRTPANRLGIGTYATKHQQRLGFGTSPTPLYSVTLINSTLSPAFFVLGKHRERFEATQSRQQRERKGWVVERVLPTDRTEEVFCAVVPGTHAFAIEDNILIGNCFGCGAGGDVFTFLREVEGLSFSEAAERLADRAGVSLRYERKADSSAAGSRRRLLAANQAAAEYFAELLVRSSDAAQARAHLESRGFSEEDAKAWKLGFAPAGRDALTRHLLGRKFSSKEIVDAGLAIVGDAGEHRDRFRGRLIFPVSDLSGQVVGFGARALGDEQPKYLNSPETPVYHKARILYGLDRAKAEMARAGSAVLTEGYTDVIALHKVGVRNAVATCGTALGEDHFALVKRFCDRAMLAFDADAAGAVASERGFGMHAKVGLEVLVAPVPSGKDPADVALAEGGDAVRRILEEARPLMRFVLEREIERQRVDTAEGKARAVRAAAAVLAWEPSRVARGEHAFWVASRIGVDPEQVQLEIAEVRDAAGGGRPAPSSIRRPGHVKVEREALAILIDSPSHLAELSGWLGEDHFTQPEHRVLFHALKESGADGRSLMSRLPDDATRRLAAELTLAPAVTETGEEVFLRLEEFRLRRRIDDMRATLDRLDPAGDAARYDALFAELMKLEEERRRFDDR